MNFFERHDRFFESSSVGTRLPDGTRSHRLKYRYEAIIERNRALFPAARVLDLASHDGRWSLAALDAGAAFVLGIEGRDHFVRAANGNFTTYNVAVDRYLFRQDDVPTAMTTLMPGSFDLILCLGIFYHTAKHYEFFEQFYRLQAPHVILDTAIIKGKGRWVQFAYQEDGDPMAIPSRGFSRSIIGHATHEMITMLCDHFRFAWRIIDWTSFGIERWDSVEDYQDGTRHTYVLSRLEP